MVQKLMSPDMLLIGVIIFAFLFILQIWAIFRVRKMLLRVSEIYNWVQAGRLGSSNKNILTNQVPRKCKNCLFRSTYLTQDTDIQFIYYCKRHDIETTLEESCSFFQIDPQYIEEM